MSPKNVALPKRCLSGASAELARAVITDVKVRSGKRGKTYVVTWKMTKGTLKQFEGTAWIQPYGKKSLLTYQMVLAPNAPVPDALLASSMKDATWEAIHRLRQRSEAIQAGKIPLTSVKVARQ